jgi:quercetin 2,3-dioxygenase
VIEIRRDNDIYDIEGEWFHARWHFSFDRYRDPENDSFGAMRVFNDDRLIPGAIWPMHPHRDIEGLTYVVEGSFGHQDDVGSVQRMSLGSGAEHSEQNASQSEPMRFIQIWILPNQANLKPQVEQRIFSREDRENRLLRVFGPGGGDGVKVHQEASVYVAGLTAGTEVSHEIGAGRGIYAYLIDGRASFDDQDVATGDAGKVTDQSSLRIAAHDRSEVILVDVPMAFEPVGIWRGRI